MLLGLAVLGCRRDALDVRRPPHFVATTPTSGTTPVVGTSPTVPPPVGDPWLPGEPPPPLGDEALAAIALDIDAIRDSTVASTGVYVLDAENGQVVYAHDEDVPMTPASNTKLFTSGLAFDALGEDHRFVVSAWSDALPDGAGAVGDLTLVGEHDFTWSTFFYESETFAAERLADRLWDGGLRRVTGSFTVAGEYEVEGWELGTYDAYYRAVAADVVLEAFQGRGIDVPVPDTSSAFTASGVLLASRASPPLSTAVHPMNVYSHNEFADLLSHHEGYELGGSSTYAAGTAEVADWLAGLGIDTSGFSLDDGSGLSHGNTVTPRQVVELLDTLLARPVGLAWERTFSTAGVLGTLDYRMTGSDTWGRFHGKSGTLTGVIATSGVLFHVHDGHRYLLSVLQNDVVDDTFARELEDGIVEVIARDLRGLGERPADPVLRAVRAPGDGSLVLDWDPVDGADGYLLWFSTDGLAWSRDDARSVTVAGPFVATDLPADTTEFVRITATNAAGESDASDVLAARTSSVPPALLLVDADDRWDAQAENPMGFGHDFVAAHAAALGDVPFESVANEAVDDGTVALGDYAAVVWVAGEESTDDESFSDAEQALVADAHAAGTALLVSGAEIAWDLDALGTATDRAFYGGVLGAAYLGDDAGTYTVEPVAGGIFDGLGELGFYTPGNEDAAYPDQLAAMPGATPELSYVGGGGGTAAISGPGLVVLGFPFETIDDAPTRAAVMARILPVLGL